jgi:hypothetical protein
LEELLPNTVELLLGSGLKIRILDLKTLIEAKAQAGRPNAIRYTFSTGGLLDPSRKGIIPAAPKNRRPARPSRRLFSPAADD